MADHSPQSERGPRPGLKRTKTKYNFFNPKLRDNSYPLGDAYGETQFGEIRKSEAWKKLAPENPELYPYLAHVKHLGNAWPHLKPLADFMETGTVPQRWELPKEEDSNKQKAKTIIEWMKKVIGVSTGDTKPTDLEAGNATVEKDARETPDEKLDSEKPKHPKPEPKDRIKRTNVTRLDFGTDEVKSKDFDKAEELKKDLESGQQESPANLEFRLFVVEDLSRDVIEILGSKLNIDPSFFRSQIMDYAWYNVRDPYRDPPSLNITARHRPWVQLRFVTARYYPTHKDFKEAFNLSQTFNVMRRPDEDENNQGFWDDPEAKIGISRTRASLWVNPLTHSPGPRIGVLLLDPTIDEGQPLWGHFPNWEAPPLSNENGLKRLPNSFKERFVHWATRKNAFEFPYPPDENAAATDGQASLLSASKTSIRGPWDDAQAPMRILLHMVCEEWLTISDYIKTRLSLIDWEISHPQFFLRDSDGGHNIDVATKKLHVWRRWVPLCREMLSETLDRVFNVPLIQTATAGGNKVIHDDSQHNSLPSLPTTPNIKDYAHDYTLLLSYMEEYQSRIDRLSTVATAFISIEDSRLSYNASRKVGLLTWLATFFLPLSFIASIFSMQSDVSQLEETIQLWAKVAFPMTAGIVVLWLVMVRFVDTPTFQSFYRAYFKGDKSVKKA
ncbi:hypothetical protein B0H67DRAFT_210102 [Lasiosphaeris hirsuta]|uniref:Uncharacterized protein n=1 Tax=Lasiosphaeris hirsuta TaxID=260670 RepID=A0AA40AS39_9PEZI|nr:hypothetical protein B0H67DRAFT_210102 [Lasiosphaeris hirsuta]